jgi:hypothetical protein
MLQLQHMARNKPNPWEQSQPCSGRRGRPWLWVGLPLFVGTAVIAGLIAVVLGAGFGTTRIWADASLIFILLPLCFMGIIPLVALIALSFGTIRLLGWLPGPLNQLVGIMERVARETRRGGSLIIRPMVAFQGLKAMVDTFLRGVTEIIR